MSGQLFSRGYGAILDEDIEVLEACLRAIMDAKQQPAGSTEAISTNILPRVKVCEIGMHDGNTARGIETFLHTHGFGLEYYGIDPDDGSTRPRVCPNGGHILVGPSNEMFIHVPEGMDLVWIDGCHCEPCVICDIALFAPKVSVGGFLCLHDTNERGQFRSDAGHQYHGPEDSPYFGLAVRHAMKSIRFPWPEWELVADRTPPEPDRIDCGTMAFRRIA